jgi:hypothetical protein
VQAVESTYPRYQLKDYQQYPRLVAISTRCRFRPHGLNPTRLAQQQRPALNNVVPHRPILGWVGDRYAAGCEGRAELVPGSIACASVSTAESVLAFGGMDSLYNTGVETDRFQPTGTGTRLVSTCSAGNPFTWPGPGTDDATAAAGRKSVSPVQRVVTVPVQVDGRFFFCFFFCFPPARYIYVGLASKPTRTPCIQAAAGRYLLRIRDTCTRCSTDEVQSYRRTAVYR